ncbi:MAG TPA: TetR/AcrR family transcriptional regulator [Streptosporangiaceae bacterium]|nr:TetR/AcrR family transcriptional regulator [Streptosporangiaceae bacterium]
MRSAGVQRQPGSDFRSRPRRRGVVLEQAILSAAWDELVRIGYRDFTIEGVAARAGTGKQAIYRRWPGRAQLVVAAMREYEPAFSGALPDTGELRADLLTVLGRAADRWRKLGPETFHGLLADLVDDPARELLIGGRTVGNAAMRTILDRAAARGEIDPRRVTPRLAALPVDLLRHDLIMNQAGVADGALTEIVDQIFLPLVQPGGADEHDQGQRPR